MAATSGGASAQSKRSTRRARVRRNGRPPTSVGQVKKSDSTTSLQPGVVVELPPVQQVRRVGLSLLVDVDAKSRLDHHSHHGAEVGVPNEKVVQFLGTPGDFAQGGAEQVVPQPPLDPDGLVGGAFRVEGLERGDVPLVGQAGGAEVAGDAVPGGL